MSEPIEPPIRWLLYAVYQLLDEATYDKLVARFEAHQRRYNRASLLRHTRRELALYEQNITTHGPNTERYRQYKRKIERRKLKIAELEGELETM